VVLLGRDRYGWGAAVTPVAHPVVTHLSMQARWALTADCREAMAAAEQVIAHGALGELEEAQRYVAHAREQLDHAETVLMLAMEGANAA